MDAATLIIDNWSWIGPVIYGVAGALAVYYGAQAALNTIETISTGIKMAAVAAEYAHAAATGVAVSATTAQTAAQYGLNTALLACPLFWVITLVIAIVAAFYAAVAAVNHFAGTTYSATGIITGILAAGAAFIGNLFISPTIKIPVKGTAASRVFCRLKAEAVEWERNGLTFLSLGRHARCGVCQPSLSFAAFDLRRLNHRPCPLRSCHPGD